MRTSMIGLMGAALVLALAQGCATKRQTGAVTGAAVGTAAGAAIGDTEGAVIGGLLGTIVGHEVGREMDRRDRLRTRRALEQNRSGESSTWVNPDTGREFQVTPQEAHRRDGGRPCREFAIVTEHEGRQVEERRTGCRRADGTWEIVD